jgi:hypothetical protein
VTEVVLPQEANLPLYGQFGMADVVLAFLLYILFDFLYHKLEQQSTIPHSNFKQHFGTALHDWAYAQIECTTTYEERSAISEE